MVNLKPGFSGSIRKAILNEIIANCTNNKITETYTTIFGKKGSGLSRLGQEIEENVPNNIFINVSFSSFHKSIPLSGIRKIINRYFEILDSNPEIKKKHSFYISRGLDKNNAPLISIFPQLRDFVEIHKGPANLSMLLRVLLMNLGQGNNPVIIYLDNFNNCDKTSMEILDNIVGSKCSFHFLMTNEITDNLRYDFYLEKIKHKNCKLSKYLLEDFDHPDIKELITNYLQTKIENINVLVSIIIQKNIKTPLMIIETIKLLINEKILRNNGKWIFDAKTLSSYNLPSTFDELLFQHIDNMDMEKREVLKYASIGGTFNSILIENITFKNPDFFNYDLLPSSIEYGLKNAILEKIERGFYSFTSQKIKYYLYNKIDPEDKAAFHQLYGEYLEEHSTNDENIIFDLAYHFSRSNELTKGVEYLIKAAEKAIKMDSNIEAIEYCKSCLETIKYLNDLDKADEYKINITFIYVEALKLTGGFSKGIEILNQIEEIVKQSKNQKALTYLNYWYGRMQYLLGNQISAIQYFTETIPMAEKLGIKQLLSVPYQIIGGAFFFKGEFYKGIDSLKKGLENLDEGDAFNTARSYGLLAWCYGALANKKQAIINIKNAEKYIRFIPNTEQLASTHHLIGITFAWFGERDKAVDFENIVIELATKSDNHTMMYSATFAQALANLYSNNYEQALELAEKSMEYSNKWNIKIGIYFVYHIFANACLELKQYEKAIEYSEIGLKIVTAVNNLYIAADFYRVLGRAYNKKTNPDSNKASEYLLKAIGFAEQLGYPVSKSEAYAEYSSYLYTIKLNEKAKTYEKKCLQELEKIDAEWRIWRCKRILESEKAKENKSPELNKPVVRTLNPNTVTMHVKPEKNVPEIPDGVYALTPIIKEITNIVSQPEKNKIINKLFKYVLKYSKFESGCLFAYINSGIEYLGGESCDNKKVDSKCICKQIMRDSLIGKKDIYVENASIYEKYKLNPRVYSRGIKSVYSSYADTGKVKSILYLETLNGIIEIDNKLKELIKHYQNITVSLLLASKTNIS
mgnify:CR=1 FL=1